MIKDFFVHNYAIVWNMNDNYLNTRKWKIWLFFQNIKKEIFVLNIFRNPPKIWSQPIFLEPLSHKQAQVYIIYILLYTGHDVLMCVRVEEKWDRVARWQHLPVILLFSLFHRTGTALLNYVYIAKCTQSMVKLRLCGEKCIIPFVCVLCFGYISHGNLFISMAYIYIQLSRRARNTQRLNQVLLYFYFLKVLPILH